MVIFHTYATQLPEGIFHISIYFHIVSIYVPYIFHVFSVYVPQMFHIFSMYLRVVPENRVRLCIEILHDGTASEPHLALLRNAVESLASAGGRRNVVGRFCGKPWENHRKTMGKHRKTIGKCWLHVIFYGIDPLVSSNMAGWKIPELNGGFNMNISYKWSVFQHAMFD